MFLLCILHGSNEKKISSKTISISISIFFWFCNIYFLLSITHIDYFIKASMKFLLLQAKSVTSQKKFHISKIYICFIKEEIKSHVSVRQRLFGEFTWRYCFYLKKLFVFFCLKQT